MPRRSSLTLASSLCFVLALACADDSGDGGLTDTDGGTVGDGDPGDGDPGDGDPGDGDPGDGDPGDGDPGDGDPGDGDPGDGDPGCAYPEGAVEPMALGEVLSPYAWPEAIHGDGTVTSLDLLDAHCDTDEVIDWSPHDILVFVSIPAW